MRNLVFKLCSWFTTSGYGALRNCKKRHFARKSFLSSRNDFLPWRKSWYQLIKMLQTLFSHFSLALFVSVLFSHRLKTCFIRYYVIAWLISPGAVWAVRMRCFPWWKQKNVWVFLAEVGSASGSKNEFFCRRWIFVVHFKNCPGFFFRASKLEMSGLCSFLTEQSSILIDGLTKLCFRMISACKVMTHVDLLFLKSQNTSESFWLKKTIGLSNRDNCLQLVRI